jgi:hypothetical protein
MAEHHGTIATLTQLFEEIESLLKEPRIGIELGRRGVNTSIALLATQGLGAYLMGNTKQASDDLLTAAEEIRSRSGGL